MHEWRLFDLSKIHDNSLRQRHPLKIAFTDRIPSITLQQIKGDQVRSVFICHYSQIQILESTLGRPRYFYKFSWNRRAKKFQMKPPRSEISAFDAANDVNLPLITLVACPLILLEILRA